MESKKKSILMRAACIAVLLLACSLVLGGSVQAKVVKAAGGPCCPKCTNAGCQHPCPPGCK